MAEQGERYRRGVSDDRSPRPVLLVSACLMGVECNYRGGASPRDAVAELAGQADLVPVCPEVRGGLPTPRPPAELQADGRVVTEEGVDVTDAFERGAADAVTLAGRRGAVAAVLKARSPSCGCHQVYDGSFTGTLVSGEGLTARALRAADIEVVDEDDVAAGWTPTP